MLYRVNNFLAVSAVMIAASEPEWQPVLSEQFIEASAVAQTEPSLVPLISSQQWGEAVADSSIELLHAYLNLQVFYEDPDLHRQANEWWQDQLVNYPREAAHAVARLDTVYIVWDVAAWPDDRDAYIEQYRIALTTALYEAFEALQFEIDELQQQIQAFVAPDLTPPNGMPFRTHPSSIEDPVLRAEYQARLDERARQRNERARLGELQNTAGELRYATASNVKVLYRGAEIEDVQALAAFLSQEGWADNRLSQELSRVWPEFQAVINALVNQEHPVP